MVRHAWTLLAACAGLGAAISFYYKPNYELAALDIGLGIIFALLALAWRPDAH